MFEKLKIERLEERLEVQTALVEQLKIAEQKYGNSYYTDKYHTQICYMVELRAKLKRLKGKIKC